MKTEHCFVAAACALVFACASHPPPTDNLASAIAAVRGAQVAVSGAGRVPQAALQLKLAEEEISQAREMIARGDNERANYMTLRAYNDAELALALAREQQALQGLKQGAPEVDGVEPPVIEPPTQPTPVEPVMRPAPEAP